LEPLMDVALAQPGRRLVEDAENLGCLIRPGRP
jgi:hypothetical protein